MPGWIRLLGAALGGAGPPAEGQLGHRVAMLKISIASVLVVLLMTVISAVYAYFRAQSFGSLDVIAAKGIEAARRHNAIFYAAVSVVVGVIGFFALRYLIGRGADAADAQYLYLAIGIGVVLEVLAAIVFKMRGLADFTFLHLAYVAGYGWLYPLALRGSLSF